MRETWNSRKNLGTLIAKLPPTDRSPASVAKWTFNLSWKRARSLSDSGDEVANSDSAKARGDCDESAKLMEEKETEPEVTSGTPPRVFADAEHVIEDWMEFTLSSTSAGSAVLPMTKHAFAARVGREARNLRLVTQDRIITLGSRFLTG